MMKNIQSNLDVKGVGGNILSFHPMCKHGTKVYHVVSRIRLTNIALLIGFMMLSTISLPQYLGTSLH